MESILKFPIVPESIYKEYRNLKKMPVSNHASLKNLILGLVKDAKSKDTPQSKLAKLILFDWKNCINHPAIYKEKSSSSALELRLALLGNGRTSDALPKKAALISTLLRKEQYENLPKETQDKICSNFREKGDAIFYNSELDSSYKISIKSLITTNKEINFGALEFKALIKGILPDSYLSLGERTSKHLDEVDGVEYKIGRGSRGQLSEFFNYLKIKGLWEAFLMRWEVVFSGIFKEDILIYIKDHTKLKIYLLSNKKFVENVYNSLTSTNNGDYSKMLLNRWEGNSIRIDKNLLLKNIDFKIEEDFENLFDEDKIKLKMQESSNYKYKLLYKD